MRGLERGVEGSRASLVVMDSRSYPKVSASLLKKLSSKNVCYVTLNNTYSSLKARYSKKVKLDNVVFVDAISKTFEEAPEQTDGCYFVSSPQSLTELSLVISKFVKHGFEYVVFDSVTSLAVYHDKRKVIRFVNSLAAKVRGSETRAVFYALKEGDRGGLLDELEPFMDLVAGKKAVGGKKVGRRK